jgi:DNA-binding IclR family transcriptional regulator
LNLEEFIKTQLESVDELRTLLLVQGAPQADWDATEIAQKLYLQPAVVTSVLEKLTAKGFVTSAAQPRYRYQPASPELAELIKQLAEMDRVRPVSLINMIYDRPTNLQAFADAFKLKPKKDN